jgi:hypothetical protein
MAKFMEQSKYLVKVNKEGFVSVGFVKLHTLDVWSFVDSVFTNCDLYEVIKRHYVFLFLEKSQRKK